MKMLYILAAIILITVEIKPHFFITSVIGLMSFFVYLIIAYRSLSHDYKNIYYVSMLLIMVQLGIAISLGFSMSDWDFDKKFTIGWSYDFTKFFLTISVVIIAATEGYIKGKKSIS